MLNFFQISIENDPLSDQLCRHIQFNLLWKLQKDKNIKRINRINIFLELSDQDEPVRIVGETEKVCNIYAAIQINQEDDIVRQIALSACGLLDLLYAKLDWENEVICNMRQSILSDTWIQMIPLFKNKKNAGKDCLANVGCVYVKECAEYIFQGSKKKGEAFTVVFARLKHDPLLSAGLFHKSYWEEDIYVIEDKFGEIKHLFEIDDQSFRIAYFPKYHTLSVLEGYMQSLSYLTPTEETMSLWTAYSLSVLYEDIFDRN